MTKMLFTIADILRATNGRLVQGALSLRVKQVCIDSQKVRKGDVFIAIKGLKHDGHAFIAQALTRGARVLVISKRKALQQPQIKKQLKKSGPSTAVIVVRDTTKALGLLARYHRQRFLGPVIGITGSAGKTTTKEMIASVLGARYRVLKNKGSENNHIGVPMTLLKLRADHDIAVLEMGTNHFGEIRWLASVACPTMAVITNIGESHLQFLKTPAKVFREKIALVKGLKPGGVVFVNKDDKFLRHIPRLFPRLRQITYGTTTKADYRADHIELMSGNTISFLLNGRQRIELAKPSFANVSNALAAISCGRVFNINYNIINKKLSALERTRGRLAVESACGCCLMDDTYNANPVSFRDALETLSLLKNTGKKILVCGDMLELGRHSARCHRQIGFLAARRKVDAVLSYGPRAREIGRAARRADKNIFIFHARHKEDLHKHLAVFCQKGNIILFKGSHGMHMGQEVEFARRHLRLKKRKNS